MLSALLCMGVSAAVHKLPRPIGGWRQAESSASRPSIVNCTWKTFQQKIDHFGTSDATFPQRYCMYSKWWDKAEDGGFSTPLDSASAPGPILFYTGIETGDGM